MTLRPASAHANSWRQDLDGISGAIRQQLFDKGSYNVAEVRKLFVGEDWTGDGTLNRDEFEHALSRAGLFLTSPEVSTIMRAWDSLGDGRIHYDGWISSLRGSMNARRRNAVELGFETIKKRRGSTTMSSVMSEFRVKEFPRVKAGLVTEEECLLQFSEGIAEASQGQAEVTIDHFYDYYSDLSGGIPSDDWFIYMMEHTWGVCEDEEKQFNAFLDSLERLFIVKAKEVAKGNEIEEKAMARIFKFFDIDGSGELDKEEFAMAMNRFGMPLKQHEIDGFFKRYDTDGGGEISFDELVERVCSAGHVTGGGVTHLAPPYDALRTIDMPPN